METRSRSNLAPLTRDVPFKRAFGMESSKESLKHLLTAAYGGSGASPLAILSIENVELKSHSRHAPRPDFV